ncbi:MAG: NUDIX hydrolase [Butyrivibrio sp.]|nr:NUDIX hydrolase [Butyrivibrio sp.]
MKRFTDIRKQTDNKFLNLYEMDALTSSGKPFNYYFATRNTDDNIRIKTRNMIPEGVLIYAIKEDEPDKILMVHQYRYPIDDYMYELPAGLIEKGEEASAAAIREVKEETGLDLVVYEGGNPDFRRPYIFAQGFSDETGCCIYGTVHGSISDKLQEDSEDISAFFADKKEVRRILHEEKISMRASFLLMNFLGSNENDPFYFLNN